MAQRFESSPRVRVLRTEQRIGLAATRNLLLREARGRYVTPCDADDLMLPGCLRRCRDHLDRHAEAGMAYGAYLMLESDAEQRVARPPWVRGRAHRETWDLVEFVANHAGSMMRRELVERVGGYDEDVPALDSVSLTLKLAEVSRLDYLEGELLYVYRRHPWSTSARNPDWYSSFRTLVERAVRRRGGG